uniref:RRM domain-containing protein n=1 Tax=Glossina brevipalpis TaxID=37001 RepID=A0A1A9W6D2_9MUSC
MDSYSEYYKGSAAYRAATSMPIILENGRKVFGPRRVANEVPPPTHKCELFVARIPPQFDELSFLVWLHRIGQVYEFRLMMNAYNESRGYAYIRFTTEDEALAALEMLKYRYITGERLLVSPSEGKSRLFLSGIPKNIPISTLEESFKMYFPNMHTVAAYPPTGKELLEKGHEKVRNRGFVFIEFADHENALEAKKRLTPGTLLMLGAELKVQWAKPKEELRAEDRTMRYDEPMGSSANDDCRKLRLYCLANDWCIPVILYGRSFRSKNLQYAGILLENIFSGVRSIITAEVDVTFVLDIHLLLCELAVRLIERHSGMPPFNYIIRVYRDMKAELVFLFQQNDALAPGDLATKFFSFKAIGELITALQLLAACNYKILLKNYKSAFLTRNRVASLCLVANHPFGKFYAILPKFRSNPKLSNNLNDMEINLLLMIQENVKCNVREKCTFGAVFKTDIIILKSQIIPNIRYVLRYVDIEALISKECYHAQQYINSNPVWIAGKTYQDDIYN